MVKMFKFEYTGNDRGDFTNGKVYLGRKTKSGETFILNDQEEWKVLESGKLTICRLRYHMHLVDTFYMKNHKEALNFRL